MYDIDKAIDELGNISSDLSEMSNGALKHRIVLGGDGKLSENGLVISPFEVLQRMEIMRQFIENKSIALNVVINSMSNRLTD